MYPAYKLIRAVNRQYPNNGFINAVSVDEETYRDREEPYTDIIPEDFRDIINDCLMDIYKEVAVEEVFSFPTIPGQNQYMLPDDCDLRDICEVTRVFGGPNPHPFGFIKPIEEIEGDTPPPPDMPDNGPYPGWIPNRYWGRRNAVRLVFARDAEELTGPRYFNAWGDNKRIGISPTPTNNKDIITIYYKKKPKEVVYMDDEIQIKEEYMRLLVYRVCMELAKSGSNPDIDLYNVFAVDFNNMLMKAKHDKESSKPFYDHVKDNERPSAYYRRRGSLRRRWHTW